MARVENTATSRRRRDPVSAKKPHTREPQPQPAEPAIDASDLAAVVDRYQLLVYSYLRARLVQESDAEDLTQEVFLRFYGAAGRFDETREIRPYLLGIARNLLRERARTLKHRSEVSWTELCLEVEDAEPEVGDFDEEMMAQLPGCIEKLGPAARMAIELHYGSRLKIKEIAERMGRSEGAVKVLLYRARQALKRCLAAQGIGQ